MYNPGHAVNGEGMQKGRGVQGRRGITERKKNVTIIIPQSIKYTLKKKRKIYREPTVAGMKPRIKSMIWNTRKKKAINSRNKKEF